MTEKQFDNNNRGSAFKNENKNEDWEADYRGSINIEGEDYWLDITVKTAGDMSKIAGQRFLAVKVRPKNAAKQAAAAKPAAPARAQLDPLDGDIPL